MSLSKHLVFWSIAARNVGRFSGRSLAIAVPLLVVMSASSALTFIKDGLLHDALGAIDSLPDVTVRRVQGGRMGTVDSSLLREVAGLKGVRTVSPRIWGSVPVGSRRETVVYTLIGIDTERIRLARDLSLALEEGHFLSSPDRGDAVVGQLFAARSGCRPGSRLALSDELGNSFELRVVGVFASAVNVFSADMIVTDLESARTFFGIPKDQFTDLCVSADNPEAADQLATSIQLLQRNLQVQTRQSQADAARAAYGTRSGVFQLMWLILLLAVLLLAWAQASSISMEMRREIGVLKALGWQTLDVIEVKMMETVIVGTAATASGILAGLTFVWMGAPLLRSTLLGWSTLYPTFPVPLHVEGSSIFLLFATGLLPLCGASIFPAWLVGTIEPDTAIRSG